jgi:hypothetical protein
MPTIHRADPRQPVFLVSVFVPADKAHNLDKLLEDNPLMTLKEVEDFLGLCHTTVWKLRKAGILPDYEMKLWRRSEVEAARKKLKQREEKK